MMAIMNPKLMISSAHPPAPVRAWADIAGARVDSDTAIGQHTASIGGRYEVRCIIAALDSSLRSE